MVVQVPRSTFAMAFFAALVTAPVGAQQDKGRDEKAEVIPKTAFPPAGLCRVWLNGVAPSQQPAVTDCTSAIRNLPSNAKVLFGDMPGVPATPANGAVGRGFEGARGTWPEGRRPINASARFAPATEGANAATRAAATAAVRSTPVSATRAVPATARPIVQPPPAKPAGKPELRQ